MTKKIIVTILAVIGLTLLVACEPPVKAQPTPDRIAMAGDSIGWQALLYSSSDMVTYDVEQKLYPGWRASHAQPRVTQDVATAGLSPDVLVVEFGHNYSAWGEIQRAELASMVDSPHPDTCVVVVKPHPAPHNAPVINGVRQTIDDLVSLRPNTVAVDWSIIAQAHPEYIDADGVHLEVPPWDYGVPPQPSAVAFADMLAAGIASCP